MELMAVTGSTHISCFDYPGQAFAMRAGGVLPCPERLTEKGWAAIIKQP
jgi:hypothetical protein